MFHKKTYIAIIEEVSKNVLNVNTHILERGFLIFFVCLFVCFKELDPTIVEAWQVQNLQSREKLPWSLQNVFLLGRPAYVESDFQLIGCGFTVWRVNCFIQPPLIKTLISTKTYLHRNNYHNV